MFGLRYPEMLRIRLLRVGGSPMGSSQFINLRLSLVHSGYYELLHYPSNTLGKGESTPRSKVAQIEGSAYLWAKRIR